MLRGVDVSNWQGGLQIPEDLDFVVFKATEGLSFTDKYMKDFHNQTVKNGQLFGFYHYAKGYDPIAEADFFIGETQDYFGYGIPVLDYEESSINVNWCEAFLNRVHDVTDVWPLIYVQASWVDKFNDSWIPEKCGLWLAGYPDLRENFTDEAPPYDISPWGIVALWQFTSNIRIEGWNSGIDGDVAYMDAKAWCLYAGNSSGFPSNSNSDKISKALDIALDVVSEYVIKGYFGNGDSRKNALYDAVQKKVNEKMGVR